MANYTLQHRFLVTATFTGFDNTSRTLTFASNDGGDATMEIATVRPGGMAGAVKLAGLDDRDDMTLSKPYDLGTDPDNEAWLDANKGCPVSVLVQPLGTNKIPIGTGRTKTGVLAGVMGPKTDSTSNDAPTLDVTLGMDTVAA